MRQTFPLPAIAWLAESQAQERREWEARSASKPSVTAASNSCRLKSAATWGPKRKAEELRPCSPIAGELEAIQVEEVGHVAEAWVGIELGVGCPSSSGRLAPHPRAATSAPSR